MTKREIIYQVFEKVTVHTGDSKISEEFVSSLIDTKRAFLIKQQYSSKSWNMPREVKQELTIDVVLSDRVGGYSSAGKVLTTIVPMPKSIKIKGKEGPLLLRKLDQSEIPINIVSIERVPYLFQNKFTQHLTYCAIDLEGKILILSNDNKINFLKKIKVTDVFESPDTARTYVSGATASDSWDDEYPIEASMIDVVVQMILKDLAVTLSIPEDKRNDSDDARQ
tara:strand:+ start:174 stop:842 length:669 start_codon:yes stop_codon:yes gene_type:complete